MIFESHAHYDDEAFDTDRDELLPRLRQQGIRVCDEISHQTFPLSVPVSLWQRNIPLFMRLREYTLMIRGN